MDLKTPVLFRGLIYVLWCGVTACAHVWILFTTFANGDKSTALLSYTLINRPNGQILILIVMIIINES
jgi:hypothetical protein